MKFARLLSLAALIAVLALGFSAVSAQGGSVLIYGVTDDNNLIQFNSADPGTTTSSVAIVGLNDGASIVGIDVRPINGQLIALSSDSRMYRLDPASGNAVSLGGTLSTPLNGSSFGFDFNPTVDRIRLTSNTAQDLRLNPNNGTVAAVDGTLSYGANDANAGATPNIVASAYTNTFNGSAQTVLYNIDASLDIMTAQVPPNNGTQITIGALGVDAGSNTSFDIFSDRLSSDVGYASINSTLYLINIASGTATTIGGIGGGSIVAIAIAGSTGSTALVMPPLCADFNGTTNPIVRVEAPAGVPQIFCRVLVENRQFTGPLSGAQIGIQSLIDAGPIQAADVSVFSPNNVPTFTAAIKICLSGEGRFIFLDARQTPRQVVELDSEQVGTYTCAFTNSPGTAVLLPNS